ncbi:MAG: hypothetical protein K2M48_00915 [Clostridiales bacterium]|nr:hypothetical protein [Clostridiales bacterium]
MFGSKKKLDSYVVETVEHNGKPKERSTYIGKLLAYDSPKFAARIRVFLCMIGLYLVAGFVVCGCFAFHNNVLYVQIPFVLQLITVALYLMSAVDLVMYGVLVKECDLGKSLNRIRPVCIIHAIFAAVCAVGDVFFILFDKSFSSIVNESVFIAFNLLSVFAALFGAGAVKLLKLHEVENPEKARIEQKRIEQKELDFLLELERKEKIRAQSKAANDARKKKK